MPIRGLLNPGKHLISGMIMSTGKRALLEAQKEIEEFLGRDDAYITSILVSDAVLTQVILSSANYHIILTEQERSEFELRVIPSLISRSDYEYFEKPEGFTGLVRLWFKVKDETMGKDDVIKFLIELRYVSPLVRDVAIHAVKSFPSEQLRIVWRKKIDVANEIKMNDEIKVMKP